MNLLPSLQYLCLSKVISLYNVKETDLPVKEEEDKLKGCLPGTFQRVSAQFEALDLSPPDLRKAHQVTVFKGLDIAITTKQDQIVLVLRNIPKLVESSCRQTLQQLYSPIPGLADIVISNNPLKQINSITRQAFELIKDMRIGYDSLGVNDGSKQRVDEFVNGQLLHPSPFRASYLCMRFVMLRVMFVTGVRFPELKQMTDKMHSQLEKIKDPQIFKETFIKMINSKEYAQTMRKIPQFSKITDEQLMQYNLSALLSGAIKFGEFEFIQLLLKAGAIADGETLRMALDCRETNEALVLLIQANPSLVHLVEANTNEQAAAMTVSVTTRGLYDDEGSTTSIRSRDKCPSFIAFIQEMKAKTPPLQS